MYRDGVSEGQFSHVLQVTLRGNFVRRAYPNIFLFVKVQLSLTHG
jgi:hypothetical protein